MDKYSVLRAAARMLGDREYVHGSATGEAFEEAYAVAMRGCNGRHDWTFARVLDKEVRGDAGGCYALPADCVRMLVARWGDGQRVKNPRYGVRASDYRRVIKTDERVGEVMLMTYTADMLQLGGNAPDCSPLFTEAVMLFCAGLAAPAVTGYSQLRGELMAQAEAALREAIVVDRRQDASNDQDGMKDFMGSDMLGLTGRRLVGGSSETHYM